MILDPGDRHFESFAPGTVYTGAARATTMGSGTISQSALFFSGDDIVSSRLCKMTKYKGNDNDLIKIRKRTKWTDVLKKHTPI